MSNDNPLKNLPADVPDIAEELVTLSTDPMKLITKKAVKAYIHKMTLATVIAAVPLVTSGGVPTISNIPARQQEDHVPSQSQDTHAAHEAKAVEGSAGLTPVSASASVNFEALAGVSQQFSIPVG